MNRFIRTHWDNKVITCVEQETFFCYAITISLGIRHTVLYKHLYKYFDFTVFVLIILAPLSKISGNFAFEKFPCFLFCCSVIQCN